MRGGNACGNVGNVSKQVKHLQRTTSKPLPLAHFCLCAGGDAAAVVGVCLISALKSSNTSVSSAAAEKL